MSDSVSALGVSVYDSKGECLLEALNKSMGADMTTETRRHHLNRSTFHLFHAGENLEITVTLTESEDRHA